MLETLPGRPSDAGPQSSPSGLTWFQLVDLAIEELYDAKRVAMCRDAKGTQHVRICLDQAERFMDSARKAL